MESRVYKPEMRSHRAVSTILKCLARGCREQERQLLFQFGYKVTWNSTEYKREAMVLKVPDISSHRMIIPEADRCL